MQLREDEDVAVEEDVTMGTALNGIKNTFWVEEIEINNRHQNESVLGNKQEIMILKGDLCIWTLNMATS